jgi:hypothetical protein
MERPNDAHRAYLLGRANPSNHQLSQTSAWQRTAGSLPVGKAFDAIPETALKCQVWGQEGGANIEAALSTFVSTWAPVFVQSIARHDTYRYAALIMMLRFFKIKIVNVDNHDAFVSNRNRSCTRFGDSKTNVNDSRRIPVLSWPRYPLAKSAHCTGMAA